MTACVRLDRILCRVTRQIAAIRGVDHQQLVVVELEDQQQAQPPHVGDLGTFEAACYLLAVLMTSERLHARQFDGLDALPAELTLKVVAQRLDLGQLGHVLKAP